MDTGSVKLCMKVTGVEFGAMKNGPYPVGEEYDIWRFIWMHRVWHIILKNGGEGYET